MVVCAVCGAENPDDAKKCPMCNNRLPGGVAAQSNPPSYPAGGQFVRMEVADRNIPSLVIAGVSCCTLDQISIALTANPREGKELILSGKLAVHLYGAGRFDKDVMEIAEKIGALIDDYSAQGKEDECLNVVAALLASVN